MTKPKYGYPMIFEFANRYLEDAFGYVIREIPTYGDFSDGGIDAKSFVPRLDKLEIKPESGGGVSLEATFHVASGSLIVNGQNLRGYVLKGPLTAKPSGTSINLEIDTSQLTITTTSTSVPARLANRLGFFGSLTLDLKGLHIGRWTLTPKEAALQSDGTRAFLGILLDIRDGTTPFPSTPQKDEQAFRNYKGTLKVGDWGYLIDRSLVPVLLNEMKHRQEASGRLRKMQLKLDKMSGPNDFEVSGSGEAYRKTALGDWHFFTLKAKAWLRIEAGQTKAHWMAIDRQAIRHRMPPKWWIKLWDVVDITEMVEEECPECVEGEFDTGLPLRLGSAQSDLGELTIKALGGSGDVVFLHGDGTAVPCDNAAIKIMPPAPPIYVRKGKSVSLILLNGSATAGRRRATLRIFRPRLQKTGTGIEVNARQPLQVAPGKSTGADDIKIKYTGTGEAHNGLVVPNNDSQQVISIHARETSGSVKVAPLNVTLTAYDAGQALAGGPVGASRNPTATVTIAHAGGSPNLCRISLNDPSGVISHDGPTGGFTLDRGQALDVRLTFNAIGLTAEQSFAASLEVDTEADDYIVRITARVTRPPIYIPDWVGRRLLMVRWFRELEALLMDARKLLKCMARRPEELLSDHIPPAPPLPWMKARFANVPEGTSLSLETDGRPCFRGQAYEGRALLLAPLLDCEKALLSLEAAGDAEDAEVGMSIERWDVAFLGAEEVETPVRGMAWKQGHLYVAGPNSLYVYTVYRFGKMRLIAAHPSFDDATGVHFVDNWLLVSRPGELLIGVAPGPEDVEVVGSLPLDGDESVALATSMDGRVFLARSGRIEVYDGGSLPVFDLLGTVDDDPALGRELLPFGPSLISLGDGGLCVFGIESQVPEIHDHHAIGPVTSALPIGESLLLRTENNGFAVLDLGQAEPVIAGQITAELPDHDALRCPSFLRFGPDGLLVSQGEHEQQIRIYRLLQYGVDEEFFSYYLAEHLEHPT